VKKPGWEKGVNLTTEITKLYTEGHKVILAISVNPFKISIDHKKSVLISFICVGQSPDWCFNVDKRLKDEPILLINERVPHSERGAQCEGLPQAYFTVPSSLRTA
jgi:hypothetical protein